MRGFHRTRLTHLAPKLVRNRVFALPRYALAGCLDIGIAESVSVLRFVVRHKIYTIMN